MPAKAGIQYRRAIALWTPAFAGVTSSYFLALFAMAVGFIQRNAEAMFLA